MCAASVPAPHRLYIERVERSGVSVSEARNLGSREEEEGPNPKNNTRQAPGGPGGGGRTTVAPSAAEVGGAGDRTIMASRAGRVILLNYQRAVHVDTPRLHRESLAVLKALKCPDFDVTIWLTDDARLRDLNLEHRGIDKPTDILSFPLRHIARGDAPTPYYGVRDLGQLFISVPYVSRNTVKTGCLENELCFMATHGILHLLGYNDEGTDAEADIMEAENERIYRLVQEAREGDAS